jgi:hypothetical protein
MFSECQVTFPRLAETLQDGYTAPVISLTKQEQHVLLTVVVLLATGLATKWYRASHAASKAGQDTPPIVVMIQQTAP